MGGVGWGGWGGGGYLPGGGCTCLGGVTCGGVYLPGGVPAWGCTCWGGTCPGGVPARGGVPAWVVYLPGGVYLPVPGGCAWQVPPPVNRMTNRCKNITLDYLCSMKSTLDKSEYVRGPEMEPSTEGQGQGPIQGPSLVDRHTRLKTLLSPLCS